jgi:hypothetical protein
MLDSTNERGSEGIRIFNAGGSGSAIMKRIVWAETVDAQCSLLTVKLRRILSVGNASSVRVFGYPAFVADVSVAAGGVHRRDDTTGFRRRVIGHRQPGAGVPVLIDVFGCRVDAHVRQAGTLEVEAAQLVAVHLEFA